MLEDIAILTGGTVITDDLGLIERCNIEAPWAKQLKVSIDKEDNLPSLSKVLVTQKRSLTDIGCYQVTNPRASTSEFDRENYKNVWPNCLEVLP